MKRITAEAICTIALIWQEKDRQAGAMCTLIDSGEGDPAALDPLMEDAEAAKYDLFTALDDWTVQHEGRAVQVNAGPPAEGSKVR